MSGEAIRGFRYCTAHLERALAIAIKIGSLGAIRLTMTDWLDQSPSAVLFPFISCLLLAD
jgi:hypothetical protein